MNLIVPDVVGPANDLSGDIEAAFFDGVGGLAGGDIDEILGGSSGGIESGPSFESSPPEGDTDLTVLTLVVDESESLLDVFFNFVSWLLLAVLVGLRFRRSNSFCCWKDLERYLH